MSPVFRRRSVLCWIIVMTLAVLFGPGLIQRFKMPAGTPDHRAKAKAQIKAMEEGLEEYKVEYGAYPRPVGGSTDPIVQAKMLYQALTGDGTNFIDGVEPTSSDGNPGTDGDLILEAAFAGNKKSGFVHEDFYLMDPWRRPYHYMRGDESDLTHNKKTFDLWLEDPSADKETWLSNWMKGR